MIWLMGGMTLVFAWMAVSMYVAAFQEQEPQMRNQLMRKGFGTLVLTLMGIYFIVNSLRAPQPDPTIAEPARPAASVQPH